MFPLQEEKLQQWMESGWVRYSSAQSWDKKLLVLEVRVGAPVARLRHGDELLHKGDIDYAMRLFNQNLRQNMKVGDRFVAPFDGRLYQVVGYHTMSYKTQWVNPDTDKPWGITFSMCPDVGPETDPQPTELTPPTPPNGRIKW